MIEASVLKVASFNVRCGPANDGMNSWSYRQSYALAAVRHMAPDILGLQEPVDYQVEYFAENLPDYDWVGAGRDDGDQAGEFCPIFVRRERATVRRQHTFWLSDTPEIVGSRTWGNRCVRICTWAEIHDAVTQDSFYVFNCHLDHESQHAREASVRLIMDRMQAITGDSPTILMGDFNATPENPALAPLRDAWRDVHAGQSAGTFHGFSDDGPFDKIDYLWANSGWDIGEAGVGQCRPDGNYPSDHETVFAQLAALRAA